jgi:hypothetical protein
MGGRLMVARIRLLAERHSLDLAGTKLARVDRPGSGRFSTRAAFGVVPQGVFDETESVLGSVCPRRLRFFAVELVDEFPSGLDPILCCSPSLLRAL